MLNTPSKYNNKATTIDSEQLKMFSNLMKLWWDPNGPMKGLHSLNVLRVPYIIEGLKRNITDGSSQSLQNIKLLDVGCGGGILSEALAKHGVYVTGIDASSELINMAIQHCPKMHSTPSYYCTTIEAHAIKNPNKYDVIVASEVIEHVNNQELFVKSCVQALKPNGQLFITTPSKTKLSQFLIIWFFENFTKFLPKGTHQYEKFIAVEDLSSLLEKNGCQIERTSGFFYNVWTNKWFWTKNQCFFYVLQAIKK